MLHNSWFQTKPRQKPIYFKTIQFNVFPLASRPLFVFKSTAIGTSLSLDIYFVPFCKTAAVRDKLYYFMIYWNCIYIEQSFYVSPVSLEVKLSSGFFSNFSQIWGHTSILLNLKYINRCWQHELKSISCTTKTYKLDAFFMGTNES